MKRLLLLSFLIIGLYFNNYAQSSCEISVNDTTLSDSIVSSAPLAFSILDQSIFNFYFKNITPNIIQLKWKVVERSIPASWEYSMCDYATCYANFLDSAEYTMYEAEPDFKSYLWWHVMPKDFSTARLRIYVYDKNTLKGDTVTWIITGVNPAGVNDINSSLRFSLFPNPASDHISIKGENVSIRNADISLHNIIGEEVMHIKSESNQLKIDLSPYKNGIYFIRIRTSEGIATKKIIVNK